MTAMLTPFRWDGEAMIPLPNFRKRCDEKFVVGEIYRMEVQEERSFRSHRHYFAAVHDAWLNLPEEYTDRFPTPEHLRKWCLIKAGFRNERSIVADSEAKAKEMAGFMRPMDDFAVIVARDSLVVAMTAKSQSMKAMGKEEFQRSKDAVLAECARLIGVDRKELERTA